MLNELFILLTGIFCDKNYTSLIDWLWFVKREWAGLRLPSERYKEVCNIIATHVAKVFFATLPMLPDEHREWIENAAEGVATSGNHSEVAHHLGSLVKMTTLYYKGWSLDVARICNEIINDPKWVEEEFDYYGVDITL